MEGKFLHLLEEQVAHLGHAHTVLSHLSRRRHAREVLVLLHETLHLVERTQVVVLVEDLVSGVVHLDVDVLRLDLVSLHLSHLQLVMASDLSPYIKITLKLGITFHNQ